MQLEFRGPVELMPAQTDAGRERSVLLRVASADDLPAIVDLLADDQLGAARERSDSSDPSDPSDLAPYRAAFASIDADPAHLLLVACQSDTVVATMQVSFIPGLSRGGMLRAQVESVRVHRERRSDGLGAAMIIWAIEEAQRRGCGLVQLTTDKQRDDAHRFYERLGFVASHEGFKLAL